MMLYAGERVFDEDNFDELVGDVPAGQGRGLVPRDFNQVPYGSMPYAAAFSLPLIPRSEWSARIKHMTDTQSRLSDIRAEYDIDSLDQGQTSYCWGHGPVSAMLLIRAANNQPYVRLSATAVCAQVTNFKNVGGYGGDALKWIAEHGTPSVDFWPINEIDPKYVTPAMQANALRHRISEWWDLKPRNFDQLMTCLLLRIPVAVGYNWWEHEVCAIDPVEYQTGLFGARIWNSWRNEWQTNGMAVLAEDKATPDDAIAPRVVTPSMN